MADHKREIGWGKPQYAREAHYFIGQNSLCSWGSRHTTPLQPEAAAEELVCETCVGMLDAIIQEHCEGGDYS